MHMTRALWMAALFAGAMMVLPGCGDEDDDSTDPTAGDDDDDSGTPQMEPSLDISSFEQLQDEPDGRVLVTYTLFGPSGLTMEMSLQYTTDATTFESASLSEDSEPLTDVTASPTGETHTVTWDSLADVGFVDTDSVWLRLQGTGDGFELSPETLQVSLSNVQYDTPCVVTLDPPLQNDGAIPLVYHIVDQKGDRCDVQVHVSMGGTSYPATLLPDSDSLEDVELEPDLELERHFVWDSMADVGPLDQTVTLIVQASDENSTTVSPQTFEVLNNPVPDPGELIFTEFLFRPDYTFPYVELYNRTHHVLDLEGLHLDADLSAAVLSGEPGALQVEPQTYVVLAQVQVAENDYVNMIVSPLSMNNRKDTLELWRGDAAEPILIDTASYDINNENSPTVDYGKAIGLRPEFVASAANDTFAAWCLEALPIAGYEGDTDFGSPQKPSNCSEEPSTPVPAP